MIRILLSDMYSTFYYAGLVSSKIQFDELFGDGSGVYTLDDISMVIWRFETEFCRVPDKSEFIESLQHHKETIKLIATRTQ